LRGQIASLDFIFRLQILPQKRKSRSQEITANASKNSARQSIKFIQKNSKIRNQFSINRLHSVNYLKNFVVKPAIFFYFHQQLHRAVRGWTWFAPRRFSAEKRTNKQLTTNNIGGTR
jgi:hypothetical protein